jgi:hypothetical protein
MIAGPSLWRLLWLAAGLTVWGSALVLVYGLHAVGCAFAWPWPVLRAVLWATLALHLVAIAVVVFGLRRGEGGDGGGDAGLLRRIGLWTALAGLGATLLGLAPPLLLTPCL